MTSVLSNPAAASQDHPLMGLPREDLDLITELVLNHTSDQHPWFQRARKAPAGSAARNFYVWNDNPAKYEGVRIIFQDFETSNWAWDPVAQAYYWHRFYSHQPDLNFDNPKVHKALFDVHREATAKVIRKAMRNEPTIDWLLENQDKVEHYYHKLGLEGEL